MRTCAPFLSPQVRVFVLWIRLGDIEKKLPRLSLNLLTEEVRICVNKRKKMGCRWRGNTRGEKENIWWSRWKRERTFVRSFYMTRVGNSQEEKGDVQEGVVISTRSLQCRGVKKKFTLPPQMEIFRSFSNDIKKYLHCRAFESFIFLSSYIAIQRVFVQLFFSKFILTRNKIHPPRQAPGKWWNAERV